MDLRNKRLPFKKNIKNIRSFFFLPGRFVANEVNVFFFDQTFFPFVS